ncbi:MAG: terminase small subunit [Pyrinomonadaceae bacterium]
MKTENLTQKQRLFCEAYIGPANGNARTAARMAGYSGDDNALSSRAFELMRNPKIAELIGVRVEEAVMQSNEVLSELSTIAKADWQNFVEIRRDKEGEIISATLKLSDKIKSLELLGKYHKLFSDRVDLNVQVNDWRDEAAKYGLSTDDIIKQIQPLIAESALEPGDTSGD